MAKIRKEEYIKTTSRTVTEESVDDGETGDPIYVEGQIASVTCIPGGTAKVQYSTSRPARLKDGVGTWIDWSRGEVTAPASDVTDGPITALRIVSVAGHAAIEVVR